MRRRPLILLCATLALAPGLSAQSSQFGVRGLGIPVRPISPRAAATGGALGWFDAESSLNPASIAEISRFAALFASAYNWRNTTNPFGSASGRDNRFPQIIAAGPIGGTNLTAAVSVSGYTDRSFALASRDTIVLSGERIPVYDTLISRGGLGDLRGAVAWRINRGLNVGLGLHVITGSNRIENRRAFGDTSFVPAVERLELSYLGLGLSAGVTARLGTRVTLAGMARADGHANVDRDTTRIARTQLPFSAGGAFRVQASSKISLAAFGMARTWSSADADIRAQGGIGAQNTYEVGAGMEILRNLKQPGHKPLRLGVRYGTLPFPLRTNQQGREFGVSAGSGIRFTGGRGGVDAALERVWRAEGTEFKETAFIITLGVSIRP